MVTATTTPTTTRTKNPENVKEPGGKYLPDVKKSINRLLKHLQNHGFHLRENMTLFMHGNALMKQCEKKHKVKKSLSNVTMITDYFFFAFSKPILPETFCPLHLCMW